VSYAKPHHPENRDVFSQVLPKLLLLRLVVLESFGHCLPQQLEVSLSRLATEPAAIVVTESKIIEPGRRPRRGSHLLWLGVPGGGGGGGGGESGPQRGMSRRDPGESLIGAIE